MNNPDSLGLCRAQCQIESPVAHKRIELSHCAVRVKLERDPITEVVTLDIARGLFASAGRVQAQ